MCHAKIGDNKENGKKEIAKGRRCGNRAKENCKEHDVTSADVKIIRETNLHFDKKIKLTFLPGNVHPIANPSSIGMSHCNNSFVIG